MYLGFGVVLVYVGIMLWVYWDSIRTTRRRVAQLQGTLTKNQVQVIHVQTEEMVELIEIEDEGAGYFFQVTPNKVLYLGGQEYYPTGKFPNSDFELVTIVDANDLPIAFQIVCHGQKLKPSRTIDKTAKLKLLDSDRYSQDLEVITGRLEKIEEVL